MTGQPEQTQVETIEQALRRAHSRAFGDGLAHEEIKEALAALASLAVRLRQAEQDRDDFAQGAWGSSAAMIVALKHRSKAAEERARQAEQVIEAARAIYGQPTHERYLRLRDAFRAYDAAKGTA